MSKPDEGQTEKFLEKIFLNCSLKKSVIYGSLHRAVLVSLVFNYRLDALEGGRAS